MAVDTYGLVWSDIKIPGLTTSQLPASSDSSIDQDDLTRWIEVGASRVRRILQGSDIDDSDLSDGAQAQVEQAIRAYTRWQALDTLGHQGQVRDNARREWFDLLEEMEGEANDVLEGQRGSLKSNVDTDEDDEFTFVQDREMNQF